MQSQTEQYPPTIHTRITWTVKQVQDWMLVRGRPCSAKHARELLDSGLAVALRLKVQRYADDVFSDFMAGMG